jgi:deoxyhypusine synthase
MSQRGDFLRHKTEPIVVEPDITADELLRRMEKISFQGRQLGLAAAVWEKALKSDAYVIMGLAGAMTAGGMRNLVSQLIEYGYINCLVSTGANIFHDVYESFGHHHYLGSHNVDDEELFEHGVDRIYDTYADEREFERLDAWIGDWATSKLEHRPYTTREFIYELGLEVDRTTGGKTPGIVTTAAKHNLPVYCPAIGDSSIGLGLASVKKNFIFDVIGDVRETGEMVMGKDTMALYCGGGTPKNFIQQTEVMVKLFNRKTTGHKWAVQFITDSPHWGGLSGCSFSEAVSWGKIDPTGEQVTVHCDTTIALPLVASAVFTRMAKTGRIGKS